MSTAIIRGQSITLNVTFFNAAGSPVDPATGPDVDIFPAGKNPDSGSTVDADARILNASQTSLGTIGQLGPNLVIRTGVGRYQYTYTVPNDPGQPIGTWYHRWNAVIDTQTVADVFQFSVVGAGSVGASSLFPNNVVTICLKEGIKALDGSELTPEFCSYYTTTYNPLYCHVRTLRAQYGPFLKGVPDDTLNLLLFEASMEADAFTFRQPTPGAAALFRHARRHFVCCTAACTLLSNQLDISSGSKSLGDLSIELGGATVGPNNVNAALQKAIDCMTKWRLMLQNGGGGFNLRSSGVVKGEYDPDRPFIGRLWQTGGSNNLPAANTKLLSPGSRRGLRSFSSRQTGISESSDNIFRGSGRITKKKFF